MPPRWRIGLIDMRERQRFEVQTVFGHIRGWRFEAPSATAPRVLALHGWLDNSASFLPVAPWLEQCELVAIDQIGHGESDHLPISSDYTALTLTRCGLAVVDALGWDRFSLLGHSLGSVVCSLIAAAVPSRVDRFVAIEALGALTHPAEQTAERFREALEAAARPRRPLRVFQSLDEAIALRMQVNHLSEPVARLLVERGVDAFEDGFVWSSDQRLTQPTAFRLTEPQALDLIRGIACPTRVILADPPQSYFPDAMRRHRVTQLRSADLHIVDGTHHLHMEDPDTIGPLVAEFLERAAN